MLYVTGIYQVIGESILICVDAIDMDHRKEAISTMNKWGLTNVMTVSTRPTAHDKGMDIYYYHDLRENTLCYKEEHYKQIQQL